MLKFFNSPRTALPLSRKKQSVHTLILWGTLALTINSVHAMNPEEEKDTYVLQTGPKAAERLDEQNEFLKKSSKEHLKKAGLSKGQIAWDVGSGSGVMTVFLAKKVGPEGHVYAIDNKPEQLGATRKKIESEGLDNVTYTLGNAQSLEDLSIQRPRIVLVRLLTMHLPNAKAVIEGVKTLLKPGGVLCIEEPILSSSRHTNLPGYIKALEDLSENFKVDYNIGNRLVSLCEEAGFSCTVEEHRPVMTPRQAKMSHLRGLEEWGPVALQKGIIQPGQIEEWKSILNSWSDAEEGDTASYYTPPKMVYVTATKKE